MSAQKSANGAQINVVCEIILIAKDAMNLVASALQNVVKWLRRFA